MVYFTPKYVCGVTVGQEHQNEGGPTSSPDICIKQANKFAKFGLSILYMNFTVFNQLVLLKSDLEGGHTPLSHSRVGFPGTGRRKFRGRAPRWG